MCTSSYVWHGIRTRTHLVICMAWHSHKQAMRSVGTLLRLCHKVVRHWAVSRGSPLDGMFNRCVCGVQAPDATLLAYRIFTCFNVSQGSWDDLLIAAMERVHTWRRMLPSVQS
jgi:hypothetical protein